MLASILIPFISALIAYPALNAAQHRSADKEKDSDKKEKNAKQPYLRSILIILILLLCASLIPAALAEANTIGGKKGVPAAPVAAACILAYGSLFAKLLGRDRLCRFLKKGAVCAGALIIAEVLIFNGKSFTSKYLDQEIAPDSIELSDNASLTEDNELRIKGYSKLVISKDLPDNMQAMELRIDGDKGIEPFDLKLSVTDGNMTTRSYIVQHKRVTGNDSNITLSFIPYGKLRSLELVLENPNRDVTINSIRALSAPVYSFSNIRYFVLLALALILTAIKEFRFYAVEYDRKKSSHILAVSAMMLLVSCSGFLFSVPGQTGREYPTTADFKDDPYIMTLDAFLKKQSYLDIDVSPELAAMEDPYDNNKRENDGISFLWDYTYYKGHYYCYFGAAPVITFYYPYYKVTGKMPNMEMANNFFAVIGLMFMCLTILSLVRMMKLKPNLLLLLLSMPTAAAAAGLWFTANCVDRYTLPSVSGLCFLMICLSAGMTAIATKSTVTKPVLLFFSGAALALCVASRPTIALCAVILVPYFIDILRDKKRKLMSRLGLAASFTVPLLIGAALIMKYNAARFDSPFQFGAIYQLTISNAAANKLTLTRIPDTIIHFFIHPPRIRIAFPFIETAPVYMENYARYTYISSGCGILMYPVFMFGLFMLPHALGKKTKEAEDRRRRLIVWLCVISSFVIAWMDFSLGGIVAHYLYDVTALVFTATIIGIFRGCGKPSENKGRYILAGVSMAATVVFTLALCIDINSSTLLQHFPHLLDRAEDLIIFWQ